MCQCELLDRPSEKDKRGATANLAGRGGAASRGRSGQVRAGQAREATWLSERQAPPERRLGCGHQAGPSNK